MWVLAVVEGTVPSHLETVSDRGLTAVVTREGPGTSTLPVDALLRHADIVAGLLDTCEAVLPMRGGSRVEREDDVRGLLHDRYDELRDSLDQVRGAVELAVSCDPKKGFATQPVADGRAYLEGRVKQWQWADEIVEQVTALGALRGVRDVRVLTHTAAGVTASVLVDRADIDATRAAVQDTARRMPASVRCTGPFPAYSFSTAGAEPVR